MKKTILGVLLGLVLIIGLTGCGSKEEKESTKKTNEKTVVCTSAEEISEEEDISMTYSVGFNFKDNKATTMYYEYHLQLLSDEEIENFQETDYEETMISMFELMGFSEDQITVEVNKVSDKEQYIKVLFKLEDFVNVLMDEETKEELGELTYDNVYENLIKDMEDNDVTCKAS